MTIFNCFSARIRRKERDLSKGNSSSSSKVTNGINTLQTKPENPAGEQNMSNSTSFSVLLPLNIARSSRCKVKVVNHDSPVDREAAEVAYEGEDESGDESPIRRRDMSDCDLQFRKEEEEEEEEDPRDSFVAEVSACSGGNINRDEELEMSHLSDPGTRGGHRASPKLKRSCSSLDMREVLKKMAYQLPPTKYTSFERLQDLGEKAKEDVQPGSPLSHTSAVSHFSADKVMLKKHSSSQILPSRSRKLWWKLFLWSHRNLQKPWGSTSASTSRPAHPPCFNQLGGYSSDTLEPCRRFNDLKQPDSPDSFPGEQTHQIEHGYENDDGGVGIWPHNQWVAFSMQSSPLQRVDEWVKDLQVQPLDTLIQGTTAGGIECPPPRHSYEASSSISMGKSTSFPTTHHQTMNLSADVLHANSVCRSLNSSSTVAHISGMGLKVIPSISHFFRLRSINLSNNSIAHITNGQLPKGLHILDLSRNKISNIEGLRELPRLRVLNLSYNKISRIGHGLSNSTLVKELYLAGNKMSDVEGLHRLLKLAVLDLSFNKITTAKGLGQLVANYSSLLALNLLGNPIQSNFSDEQLRKAVCGLLPKLAYLNKQPINQKNKARQVATDIVVKASSGSSRNGRRKVVRKVSHGGSLSSITLRSNASVGHRSKNKLSSTGHQLSNLRIRSPAS